MANRTMTFDQLPEAVHLLTCEVQELKKLLESKPDPFEPDEILNLKSAAKFLGVAEQTIYQMGGKLPRHKRFGKLYFKRSELIAFIEKGH